MYFTVNIFASLCYINDIFLMNLSIVPHGDLYLLQCLSFITLGLLIVQSLFKNFHCLNLVLFTAELRSLVSRFRWDCKGRNVFQTCKLYFKINETFYFVSMFAS